MLKVLDFTQKRNTTTACVLLLGGFDGLHIGHKKLLKRAKAYGLPIGIMTILFGKRDLPLFTLSERADVFARAGLDFAFALPFDEIRGLSPQEFLTLLTENFQPQAFVCGDDFRFGKNAVGDAEALKTAGQVCVESLCRIDGEKVSTTLIKSLLAVGNVQRANELLGERFFLKGRVYKDRGVGNTIGFPTANIEYPRDKFTIKQGVYETRVTVDGNEYKGITNYGRRPTFDVGNDCTETHVIGFSGDLYGRDLKVEFVRYLRDIQKFDNIEGLKTQLQKDVERVNNAD